MRAAVLCLALLLLPGPAAAQDSQEVGQMRLYIQQLEERLRQLTGQNEQLTYELNQLRARLGVAGAPAAPGQVAGAAPAPVLQDPSIMSISPDDPLIAPDGVGEEDPADLAGLAGGDPAAPLPPAGLPPGAPPGQQTAAIPGTPAPSALSGSARDEYDLAYGYILTGDYGLAEQSFQNWLAAFPGDAQATDARFWLGESHFQQGEYRDAANAFLGVYKAAPEAPKAPDALLKLGMSLSALGEKNAACATLAEVGRKYPQASAALISRVGEEERRAGC